MAETNFMRFWRELNDWMIVYGEGEVFRRDARDLYTVFGEDAEAAADHEAGLRRLAKQAELEEV